MTFNKPELWNLNSGKFFDELILLSFVGEISGIWKLRPAFLSEAGIRVRVTHLKIGMITMATARWHDFAIFRNVTSTKWIAS